MAIMLDRADALGYQALMVTWTLRHHRGQSLKTVLDGLMAARRKCTAARQYKNIKKDIGVVGSVRAIEVTHGHNGWHPHIHEIWILSRHLTPSQNRSVQAGIACLWKKYVRTEGLDMPDDVHGVVVQGGRNAARYVAKWGLQSELSAAARKSAAPGHLTPWEILERSTTTNNHGQLWREYIAAITGRRQLVRSRGLTALLSLAPEQTDLDLADTMPEERVVLCIFEWNDWIRILRDRADLELLIAAADYDASFDAVIGKYGGHPVDQPTADNIGPYRPRCYATGVGYGGN